MGSVSLLERYQRISSDLAGSSARLIAVSKTQPVSMIEELYRAGHRDFGENYVQELLAKDRELKERGISDLRWHFLGHLQTNKVRQLLPIVHAIHSVDSVRLAQEISKRATGPVRIFIEVNVEGESTKSGFNPQELTDVLPQIGTLPHVEVRGLMCIPSPEGGGSGRAFRELRALKELHRVHLGVGELSMGMSEDYGVAIREGSSWVRVGTALFGPRKP